MQIWKVEDKKDSTHSQEQACQTHQRVSRNVLRWQNLQRKQKRTQARDQQECDTTDNEKKESMTTIAQLDAHVEQQHLTRKNKKMKMNEKTGEEKEQAHTRKRK